MAETPPPTLATVLADIQRNMAAMQQRADQADASMNNLRALIEERLPAAAAAPQVDQGWADQLEAEWEAARADPLDGLSLFMLFYQPEPASLEEEEYVWDPQPTTAQLAWDQNFHFEQEVTKDDVDEAYLKFYVDGEAIPSEHRQLGSFIPLFKLEVNTYKFIHNCYGDYFQQSNSQFLLLNN
ncbi:hypothetical protein RHMOL_Rhmol08G0176100 [Rhododendron molle]|uniref:Uncharacterized protein n=1 Tax=Rhododendron molle TaxID=49168 RepID=A0ACC0MPP4_RHOML|nr:hypothetical protein RHMOL_Rhmol08G0176100 [Rhododendron molle]